MKDRTERRGARREQERRLQGFRRGRGRWGGMMQPEVIVAIVVALLVIGSLVVFMRQKRESESLRERFGPEYDRAVEHSGDRRAAERELRERQERRRQLDIRPLPPPAQERYAVAWRDVQRRFVDAPNVAVREAHTLVIDLMRDRGYPMENFEQRIADISVDHSEVVDDYRAANAISMNNDEGRATTEDLRQAMVHFRSLFERLLNSRNDADKEAP